MSKTLEPTQWLHAWVDAQSSRFIGDVEDLAFEGMRLSISDDQPQLPVGALVKASICDMHHLCTVPTPARVFEVHSRRGIRQMQLIFDEPHRLWPAIPETWKRDFGRRRAVRVKPAPRSQIVPVEIRANSCVYDGRVHDFSRLGIGIVVPLDLELELENKPSLELRFALPPSDREFCLVAELVHRRIVEDGVLFGLAFLPHETQEFAEQQQELDEVIARILHQMYFRALDPAGDLPQF